MEENTTAQTNQAITIAEDGKEIAGVQNQEVSTQQTPEQNREFAKIRRNQEREKFEKEITEKVKLSTVNQIFSRLEPDLKKEFGSMEEFEEYFKNSKFLNDTSKENLDIQNQDEFWYQKDKELFFKQNPDFNEEQFKALLEDDDFCEFSSGKVGKEPLFKIYQEYHSFLKKVENLATQKAERMYLKRISSPGSLSQNPYNSKKLSWSDMSEQEFEKAISNAKKGYYTTKK
ncbi:MAG: hypothetical protein IJW82_05965 [Clostridia bacterium]|nr:hypothetical protein [Clostridia bacterium]